MIPSKKRLKAELKALRELIDTTPDPAISRIAYGMETAMRWATEDTKGWATPAEDATILAGLLRKELGQP